MAHQRKVGAVENRDGRFGYKLTLVVGAAHTSDATFPCVGPSGPRAVSGLR